MADKKALEDKDTDKKLKLYSQYCKSLIPDEQLTTQTSNTTHLG